MARKYNHLLVEGNKWVANGEKAGRPPMGAPLSQRLDWCLMQVWQFHHEDDEARRAFDCHIEVIRNRRQIDTISDRSMPVPPTFRAVLSHKMRQWFHL